VRCVRCYGRTLGSTISRITRPSCVGSRSLEPEQCTSWWGASHTWSEEEVSWLELRRRALCGETPGPGHGDKTCARSLRLDVAVISRQTSCRHIASGLPVVSKKKLGSPKKVKVGSAIGIRQTNSCARVFCPVRSYDRALQVCAKPAGRGCLIGSASTPVCGLVVLMAASVFFPTGARFAEAGVWIAGHVDGR